VVKEVQSYTSTPAMGRTACTEPQCLYKGALYFNGYGLKMDGKQMIVKVLENKVLIYSV